MPLTGAGALHQGDHRIQLGNPPNQLRIANARQLRIVGDVRRSVETFRSERRFPHLQRVHQRRFLVGIENHQMPVFEQGVTVANQGHIRLFANQVVAEQDHLTGALFEEDIQHVFAVGGPQGTLEPEIPVGNLEGFQLAGTQVVTRRKNQAVIVRQRRDGTGHGVNPLDLALGAIEQVIAPVFFVKRQNPYQQNLAQIGKIEAGVVQ